MQSITPALTGRQRFWLKHIQACEASGKTIAAYAAAEEFGAQGKEFWGHKEFWENSGDTILNSTNSENSGDTILNSAILL